MDIPRSENKIDVWPGYVALKYTGGVSLFSEILRCGILWKHNILYEKLTCDTHNEILLILNIKTCTKKQKHHFIVRRYQRKFNL